MKQKISKIKGFSLVEVLLAGAVFALFITVFVGVYIYGQESVRLSGNRNRAIVLAEEGLEAARNIRDSGFDNLMAGSHGLGVTGENWDFVDSQDSVDIYERQILVNDINQNTKEIISTVTWQQNLQRTGEVSLSSLLTNWKEVTSSCDEFAITEGYVEGTCRSNSTQCDQNGEDYLAEGDVYCVDPADNSCCALSDDDIQSCDDFAVAAGYISGACRNKCKKTEEHLLGGDSYCDGREDTCCGDN
ncbi:MAG: hypothetical protein KAQ63_01615 [Candidatus Moranbacteria bacterium]|nr:hypothetical protein [Candidatus Moranbacteria bacterium]